MDDKAGRNQHQQQGADNAGYYAEFTREEWIAYLAGRETPAYAGWADNFSTMGNDLNRQDAKDAKDENGAK